MCGIFGYIGHDNGSALKTLQGLKDLEYRGYDSWGIVTRTNSGILFKKNVGKISSVAENEFLKMRGAISLGHTRWATHGGVLRVNAHPHFNATRTLAVVHNGIIENYEELRNNLEKKLGSRIFKSQTDTEVIPHLIDFFMKQDFSFEKAFVRTCRHLKGRFAFAAIHKDIPVIFAAREGSPLVVGVGENEYFIASDTPAFLDHTNIVYHVDNGEYIKVGQREISFFNYKNGKAIMKKSKKVLWEKERASKEGWAHYMIKEIFEQKEALGVALLQDDTEIKKIVALIKKTPRFFLTACGTAGHVCMVAEYLFSHIANKETRFISAGEFGRFSLLITKKDVLLAVTQSGETADLLEAIHEVKKKRGKVVSVLNVRGSSVERESDYFLPINAGPEKAVASTKAASSQMMVLTLLAYALIGKEARGRKELAHNSEVIQNWLTKKLSSQIRAIAKRIVNHSNLYSIGKGIHHAIALEAALKIKEVSYIHAEGFSAGELKHGPIALIERGTPCIVFLANDEYKGDVLSNAEELKARGAFVIGVSPEAHPVFDRWISVPDIGYATAIASMIAAQLLAYHLAVLRGINPDMPRNLAKSVTVK